MPELTSRLTRAQRQAKFPESISRSSNQLGAALRSLLPGAVEYAPIGGKLGSRPIAELTVMKS